MADKPDVTVEIQFSSGVWTNVTTMTRKSVNVKRGSTRVDSPVVRYEPGIANVKLDNSDRRFDPTNLSGPYVSAGKTQVTAMRPIRIKAIWNSVTYSLFSGFIDEWDIDWVANVYSEVSIPSTDGFKILANKKRGPVDPAVGEGETSGARVTRILNSANWSATDRLVSTGNSPMTATTLVGSPLEELQNVAESEIGELYIDGSGRLVFRNRHALILDTRSNTVQVDFGSDLNQPAPFDLKLNTDDATLWNEVRATRIGGATQSVADTASITEFNGAKTFEKSNLWLRADSVVSNYANWILSISSRPEIRFDAIAIYPMKNPTVLFQQILSREIGDRVRITRRPPGGGSPIVREVFIRGIAHDIGQATWKTTFTLQSATSFGNFFTLDSPTFGVLGAGYPLVF